MHESSKTIFLLLFAAIMIAAGCGTDIPKTERVPPAPQETGAPSPRALYVLADAGFTNLQLENPTLPVYDRHTLAERRSRGLTTSLPEIRPYASGRIAYLTFDDGPDDVNTPAILDILKAEGVPATFYVVGRNVEAHPDILKRIHDENHAIGNHSYSHDNAAVYASPEAFLAEMEQTDEIIFQQIGMRPLIVRAPGGTASGQFTDAYWAPLAASGYAEHDWNVDPGDSAGSAVPAADLVANAAGQLMQEHTQQTAIILLHCAAGHETTVDALPEIIHLLKEQGFSFGVVTPMTPTLR